MRLDIVRPLVRLYSQALVALVLVGTVGCSGEAPKTEGLPEGTPQLGTVQQAATCVTTTTFTKSTTGATADSDDGSGHVAGEVYDGSTTGGNYWQSANTAVAHWVYVDLTQSATNRFVSQVVLSLDAGNYPVSYTIALAPNGAANLNTDAPWTTILTKTNGVTNEDPTFNAASTPALFANTGRYLRIKVTSASSNQVRINEVTVTGDNDAACTPAACAPACGTCRTCNNGTCSVQNSGTTCGSGVDDTCTDPDTCNGSGTCLANDAANGTACPNGTVCDGAETCNAGVCGAGTALNCNDGNTCTTDSCDAVSGCSNTTVSDGTVVADDGSVCTNEVCFGGIRQASGDTSPACACTCSPATLDIDNFNTPADYNTNSVSTPDLHTITKGGIGTTGAAPTTNTVTGGALSLVVPGVNSGPANVYSVDMDITTPTTGGAAGPRNLSNYTGLSIRASCGNAAYNTALSVYLYDGSTLIGGPYTPILTTSLTAFALDISGLSVAQRNLVDKVQVRVTGRTGGATDRSWSVDYVQATGGPGGCKYADGVTSCGCTSDAQCGDDGNPCTATPTCAGPTTTTPSLTCRHNTAVAGTPCRAAAGVCDVAEACDGTAVSCPADGVAAAGTSCRGAADVCDAPETCTGSSDTCPADGKIGAGTECRAAVAGGCDVAEACDGTNNACPTDQVVASGTLCRGAAGVCDAAESCDGSNTCPADAKLNGSTTCRPAVLGGCDIAEVCSGGNDCPADIVVASGVTCRGAAGLCDAAEVCNGTASSCPA
ncbi:MAG TPA: hypothetical protein VHO25_09300, partial [Polyangiaceae bacterium]|nr:hypothetical protein [Polyangiaceae bacterium]